MAAVISQQSEARLIAACLHSVRELARLDEDPVLPPPPPPLVPRHEVVVFSAKDSAKIHDRFTTRKTARWTDVNIPIEVDLESLRAEPTKKVGAPPAKKPSSALALLLCGLVAGVAAGAAFLASPMGERPDVQRTTHAVEREAGRTIVGLKTATVSFVRTLSR